MKIKKWQIVVGLLLVAGVAIGQYSPGTNYTESGATRTVVQGSLDVVSGGDLDIESGGSIKIAGTAVTSTAAELNALDGITSTVSELNILDGVTSTASELNILDGVTSTASELNILDGVTSTFTELNILDGVTATAAQLNAVDGGAVVDRVVACGQADEGGTIFLGPAVTAFLNPSTESAIGGTVCDALDNATEATADAPILTDVAFKVLGALCATDGTLGAGETVAFTIRSAEADTTPAQTCTISEAESYCSITTATTTDVAAGATLAVEAVQSSDNADDNLWCRLAIAYQ